ncbi:MAG: glycosyltransferase family 39 protein [Butyrivibrio sp.]|nr:glycosyltransferase family 39 protein [Butyrivibrio sp.]
MRIIDYYNYIATAVYILVGVAAVVAFYKGKKTKRADFSDRTAMILFALIMVLASFLRLYKLGEVPLGLQQDEASIGYDAYTLATYGIDRNGYHWPVYPITWGCGGGSPLLIYINVITISLFGTGIVKLRLIPAVLGIITVALFYWSLRLIFENRTGRNILSLLGALFLAVCPWHIILSRWSLDCNIMPFNMMAALLLYLYAAKKKSTLLYCLSAAAFAVCMYSYGAATIIVPLFLLMICIYSVREKVLTIRALIASFVTFMVVFAPLLLFYGVNYLGLPEIVTPYVCFNRFTAARTGEAFLAFDASLPGKLFNNIRSLFLALSIGDSSYTMAHYYDGYACLFEFTFPITAIGLILCIRDVFGKKNADEAGSLYRIGSAAYLFFIIGSAVLELVIVPDVSRLVMLFIPAIFLFVRGAAFVYENVGKLLVVVVAFLLVGGVSFSKDYFTDYSRWAVSIYMPGYGDAIKRAYEVAGDERTVYSTYDGLSSPFMLALYYNEYDPYKFFQTVVYKDEKAEFRIAESFGNFIFKLPEEILAGENEDAVFVLSSGDIGNIELPEDCKVEDFGGYWVVYK